MIRKGKWLAGLLAVMITMSGCISGIDINRQTIITLLALDRNNYKNEYTGYYETISLPKNQFQSESMPGFHIYRIGAETIPGLQNEIRVQSPDPVFFGALQAVVVGQNFAEEGILPYINRFMKMHYFHKSTPLVYMQDPAELEKLKNPQDISCGFLINSLLSNSTYDVIEYPYIYEIYSRFQQGNYGFALPYIGLSNDESSIQYEGICIFSQAKLAGVIDMSYADVYRMMTLPQVQLLYPVSFIDWRNKENELVALLEIGSREIETHIKNDVLEIYVTLNLNADVKYAGEPIPLEEQEQALKLYAQQCSQELEEQLERLIENSQTKYKSDFLNFLSYFRAQNNQIYRNIYQQWDEYYVNAQFHINVNTSVRQSTLGE